MPTYKSDAFDVLTEEAMYWLGFLFADGCVQKTNYTTVLCLSVDDADQVQSFMEFVGSSATVKIARMGGSYSDRPMATAHVNCKALWTRLIELGMGLKVDRFPVEPECLKSPHFWRGMMDGDGSVGLYAGRRKTPTPMISFCGNKKIVDAFIEFCKSVIPNTKAMARKHSLSDISTTSFDCANARKIVMAIYGTSGHRLQRKDAIAVKIMEQKSHECMARIYARPVATQPQMY